MRRPIKKALAVLLMVAGACTTISCGEPPTTEIEASEAPIYNGTSQNEVTNTGVVRIGAPPYDEGPDPWACSGTVYNRYWVITAAHCFKSTSDPNNDGVITAAEAHADSPTSPFNVQRAMTSSGALTDIATQVVFRQPPGLYWGNSANPDVALVRLDTAAPGVYVPNLYFGFYYNGQLRVYPGSTRTWNPLQEHLALSYGYGPIDPSWAENGILHAALVKIVPYGDMFGEVKYNDAGPLCPGDSGGPDMYQVGPNDYQDIGIHHSGDLPADCSGRQSWSTDVQVWRDWVYAVARPNREATKWRDIEVDGKEDLVFFRPSNGKWYAAPSLGSGGVYFPRTYGQSGDVPVPGDYDGDARTDHAVYHPSTGMWYVRRSSDGSETSANYGSSTDTPVPGDYDGDGITNYAVVHPFGGIWYWYWSPGGAPNGAPFGASTDTPVPGDYDGDGITNYAVYRPSEGKWYWSPGGGGGSQLGGATDTPVPADYDGDGKTDFATYRSSDASWRVLPSGGGGQYSVVFGQPNQSKPVPRDYDGDRKADLAYTRYEYVSGQGNRVTLNVKSSRNGAITKKVYSNLYVSGTDLTP